MTTTRSRTHEDEEEEDDQFYESLDRILSSSCSSTSASDNDDPTAENHHHRNPSHRRRRSSVVVPRSLPPPHSAAYDVWISEPSSVEERRRRLLQNMGLTTDLPPPSLPAVRTDPVPDSLSPPATPARSVSLEEHRNILPSPSATLRSKSEGYDKANPVTVPKPLQSEVVDKFKEQCLIRNLDTGTEFVVKEVREDGTWEKVKEITTGKQFTLEEFEMRFSSSPIVQELMRRQQGTTNLELSTTVEPAFVSSPCNSNYNSNSEDTKSPARSKKKKGWLNGFKSMAGVYHHKHTKSGNIKDTSAEKGMSRLSSVTDDGLDGGPRSSGVGPERIRIRQYGKSLKEFTGVHMTQEIKAHTGAVWSICFSFDGKYLASAGEDKVIHVWEVVELEKKNVGSNPELAGIGNGSPDAGLSLSCVDMSPRAGDKKKRGKVHSRKSVSSHHVVMPERVFQLGEKPTCSLHGHEDDVLDLSWSKSQHLLSSSMDKTVRLWDISTQTCLKTFSHSDYVTCIQFNPVDNRYFISGSLDEKVRVWSIQDRKIVNYHDLHEMVTAACYTPDGQGALVGSHNGGCHLFDTSDNKLHYKSQVDLHGRRKKSNHKKITGFQFVPGSTSEVLITSADSRIRVVNGAELVHKLKGFRNTSSQISASISSNGKYVICASEDSHVYIWRYEENPQPAKAKSSPVNITHSYENFHCHHVTVAATWPGSVTDKAASLAETNEHHQSERFSNATWPEENLAQTGCSPVCLNPIEVSNGEIEVHRQSAWGLVIVTAARGGQIRVFQNFGFPINM